MASDDEHLATEAPRSADLGLSTRTAAPRTPDLDPSTAAAAPSPEPHFSTATAAASRALGPDRAQKASLGAPEIGAVPPSLYERFDDFALLGRGGMGAVYRAHDSRLRRAVAIKVLSQGALSGGSLNEARAQARVTHPNICEVYEAGVADGVPFIVMRYVDGASLQSLGDDLSLEEKVRLLHLVALALHEAHRGGLVHRDVKPGNVLIERAADGSLRPYIADFGIARDLGSAPAGASHGPAGTPAFMAPEQTDKGALLDRRTDVYGIGATLYTALTGLPPFSADTLPDLLAMVRERRPASPRSMKPTIPLDLEAIVMRCLEKSPDARYESAKALAQDLARFLDGDPVLARPRNTAARLLQRARKHRALFTLGAAALTALLVVAGLWVRSLRIAAQREDLARELGGAVREMELFMRGAHLLPLHDIDAERDVLRARLSDLESRTKAAGEIGEGPGHDALGRGYLALEEPEQALSHFEAAAATGYKAPGFDHATGLALIEVYRRELSKANRLPNEADKASRIKGIQLKYRDPALSHLRAAVTQGLESPAYARGLIAYHEGRFEDAVELAEEAFSRATWLYEAKKLEGDAELSIGDQSGYDRVGFDPDVALLHLRKAAEAYRKAAEIARSEPSVHESECELWIQMVTLSGKRGEPVRPPFETARAACERAMSASPKTASSELRLAFAYQQLSWRLLFADHPSEPVEPVLEEAVSVVESAARRSPSDPFAAWLVGAVWRNKVYLLRASARDSGPALDRSIRGYVATIALDPTFSWAFSEECEMLAMRAQRESFRGVDPTESIHLAHARCRRGREIDPGLAGLDYMTLFVYAVDAERLLSAGKSPSPAVTAGVSAAESAWPRVHEEPWIAVFRAELHRREAEMATMTGKDATPSLAEAGELLSGVPTSVLPGDAAAPLALSEAESLLTRLLRDPPPRSPSPELQQAISRARKGFTESLSARRIDLSATAWRTGLVRTAILDLRARMATGQPRWEDADSTLEVLSTLAEERPEEDPRLDEAIARAHEIRADLALNTNREPSAEIASGLARAERAVNLGPGLGACHAVLGRLLVRRARLAKTPEEKRPLAARAESALKEATKQNPTLTAEIADWLEESRALR